VLAYAILVSGVLITIVGGAVYLAGRSADTIVSRWGD
jgi:hypothetical protein